MKNILINLVSSSEAVSTYCSLWHSISLDESGLIRELLHFQMRWTVGTPKFLGFCYWLQLEKGFISSFSTNNITRANNLPLSQYRKNHQTAASPHCSLTSSLLAVTKSPLPAGKGSQDSSGWQRDKAGAVSASLVALSCPWPHLQLSLGTFSGSLCIPPLGSRQCPEGCCPSFYGQHPTLRSELCSWQLMGGAGRARPYPALQRGGTAASDSTQSWVRHGATRIYRHPCFLFPLKLIPEKTCSILSGCSLDREEYHWELLQRLCFMPKPSLNYPMWACW